MPRITEVAPRSPQTQTVNPETYQNAKSTRPASPIEAPNLRAIKAENDDAVRIHLREPLPEETHSYSRYSSKGKAERHP